MSCDGGFATGTTQKSSETRNRPERSFTPVTNRTRCSSTSSRQHDIHQKRLWSEEKKEQDIASTENIAGIPDPVPSNPRRNFAPGTQGYPIKIR